jgi:hypothetical protein
VSKSMNAIRPKSAAFGVTDLEAEHGLKRFITRPTLVQGYTDLYAMECAGDCPPAQLMADAQL